ncbi:MAG TPA: hypothetical protein VMI56_25970 [Reyranella sp.]|nr:hypothetical protein [Reyranella sp.]
MSAAFGRRLKRAHKKAVPEPVPDMTGWTEMERLTWEFKRYGLEEMIRRAYEEPYEEEDDDEPAAQVLSSPPEEIAVVPTPPELPPPIPEPEPEAAPAPEPAPPPDPDAERRQAWLDEHVWWRQREARDYAWDEPRTRRLDDYDPFEDDSFDC